jgi:hypothetical protein
MCSHSPGPLIRLVAAIFIITVNHLHRTGLLGDSPTQTRISKRTGDILLISWGHRPMARSPFLPLRPPHPLIGYMSDPSTMSRIRTLMVVTSMAIMSDTRRRWSLQALLNTTRRSSTEKTIEPGYPPTDLKLSLLPNTEVLVYRTREISKLSVFCLLQR